MTAKAYHRGSANIHRDIDAELSRKAENSDIIFLRNENYRLRKCVEKRTAQVKRLMNNIRRERVRYKKDREQQEKKSRMLFLKLDKEIAAHKKTAARLDEIMEVIYRTMTDKEFKEMIRRVREE